MANQLRLTFLGTSAGTPTKERNVTAQHLLLPHGGAWLLDCGEGTQHRLLAEGLKAARIERILLTHLHGDHCYGLWGLLSRIAIDQRVSPVEIVGPRGVAELINTVLRLSAAELSFPLVVTELDGPTDLAVMDGWAVTAVPIVHRVPCFAYVVKEPVQPGRFHLDRAMALGIPPGPDFRRLQLGQTITVGGREILPAEVLDPPRPGRVIALLGDTSDPESVIPVAAGCDLVVCEATYDHSRAEKAKEWGHFTAAQSGRLAHALAARRLIITHFSSRYGDEPDGGLASVEQLRQEAAQECPGTEVLAARDGLQVRIDPRG